MIHGVLALFVRTMREENRRLTTYAVRLVLLLLVLSVVAVNHQSFRFGGGAPGRSVFAMVTTLNLAFICVVGLGYFASAITEEKEDGTLGLLRMTNLNPLSILLGKSTSRLIGVLLLFCTQLPFVMLAVTLGGVSLKQILTCYGIMMAFTFLLANLALFFSVMVRKTMQAVVFTLGALVLTFVGFWLLAGLFTAWLDRDLGFAKLASLALAGNPFYSLEQVFNVGFDETQVIQPVSNVVAGLVFFLLAWLIFDHFNQGEGRGATPGAARRRRVPVASKVAPTALRAKPRPGTLSVTWREFYYHYGGMKRFCQFLFLILILLGAFIGFGTSIAGDFPEIGEVGAMFFGFGVLAFFLRWALAMGSVFKHERKNRTWPSLSLLPRSIQRIAYEKVLASFFAALPGLLVAGFGIVILFLQPEELEFYFMFESDFIYGFSYGLALFLFASHLVVYLSLFLKWGALPVAVMVGYVFQMVLALVTFFFRLTGESIATLWIVVFFGGSCLLHALIGKRLKHLSGVD